MLESWTIFFSVGKIPTYNFLSCGLQLTWLPTICFIHRAGKGFKPLTFQINLALSRLKHRITLLQKRLITKGWAWKGWFLQSFFFKSSIYISEPRIWKERFKCQWLLWDAIDEKLFLAAVSTFKPNHYHFQRCRLACQIHINKAIIFNVMSDNCWFDLDSHKKIKSRTNSFALYMSTKVSEFAIFLARV